MKLVATAKRDQNRTVADPWTFVHFSAGLALGLVNAPLKWSLAAAVAYELVEQYIERSEEGKEFFDTAGPEVIPNAILDLAVFAAGHHLGQAWNRTR
jgi:hypothetical protein